ncbi:hypothetical protein T310_2395 [Rasamsonia emersonii CBS 393.64]|uniref:FAD-binding PCMH-type domain-containing protein n=1 Tax=Rasamsonia emersonii (strain ATCC 16479 / CBS 393.64 / IMI 116815) TaxID=1408163 RepID=A0A0F4Z0D9_RASE3|nr:hypothetical protein T310_2395 [Rasamsonia emersonii CBS 393.64]KKA23556.1 hypothetical protein T310_2395 [Rasamsonia emersonii CBS 393.64]
MTLLAQLSLAVVLLAFLFPPLQQDSPPQASMQHLLQRLSQCDFLSSGAGLSFAVSTLVRLDTLFAVVGGGHMPIPGANNINGSGVLIACKRLNQLRISPDLGTVHVGPGNRWVDVYRYLAPYNRSAVGGRVGHVGVPGYLLGGGVSFFGNEYGWASANVASFTVSSPAVLANGSIVTATPTNEYSDLFWALRGGGNSFALVTDFGLRTVPSGKVYVGTTTFDASVSGTQFLDKVYEYGLRAADDPKAAVIPLVEFSSGSTTPSYSAYLFYNGENAAPEPLEPFLSLPQTSRTFSYRTMYDWSLETDTELLLLTGFRQRFWVLPVGLNRTALQIIHDTYIDSVRQFSSSGIYLTALAVMPVPRTFFTASQKAPGGGDPKASTPHKSPTSGSKKASATRGH